MTSDDIETLRMRMFAIFGVSIVLCFIEKGYFVIIGMYNASFRVAFN